MMINRLIAALLFLFAMLFSTGCNIGGGTDSNITVSIRVSAFSYVKENSETNETNLTINGVTQGYYISRGRYDFYDENISGERRIENGIFEYDVNCSDFNIEKNTTAPILRAPDKNSSGSHFAYINVNPFTTLMVDENLTADELNAKYEFTAAYDVDPDFNFDTYTARYDRHLPEESSDYNLTDDICRALKEVINLQP